MYRALCSILLYLCNKYTIRIFNNICFLKQWYIITDSLMMMYKQRNILECFKRQILLKIYIVYLLEKYNKKDNLSY